MSYYSFYRPTEGRRLSRLFYKWSIVTMSLSYCVMMGPRRFWGHDLDFWRHVTSLVTWLLDLLPAFDFLHGSSYKPLYNKLSTSNQSKLNATTYSNESLTNPADERGYEHVLFINPTIAFLYLLVFIHNHASESSCKQSSSVTVPYGGIKETRYKKKTSEHL